MSGIARTEAAAELMLAAAGTAARRERSGARCRELAAAIDWPELTRELRARKLLPLIGPRLPELCGPEPELEAAVAEALEQGRRQGAFLDLISAQLAAALAAAGIPSAPLKGPALSEAIYGDPGRRLSSDIDLLVPAARLVEAVATVRPLGYAAPEDPVGADGLPLLHFALVHETGEWPPVELHWRIHWYERRFAEERLLPPAGAAPGWRPEPADELAALLLYYARDGFIDLRLPADLGAWWDRFGAELPAAALDPIIAAYPPLARPLRVAARVADQVVGLPAEAVLGPAAASRRERIAARLANPNPQPDSAAAQLYADRGLVDGLLAPPGGFGGFVRRQLLPSRAVLDKNAVHGRAVHGRGAHARSRATRFFGVLGRYLLTLARSARSPAAPASSRSANGIPSTR